jgi:pimeloyl-ACP methyl ester carboxylesterase
MAGVAGAAGLGGASGSAGTSGASGSGGGAGDGAEPSMGCNNEPTLESGDGSVMSGGMERTYELRLPEDYDNRHPYRLMLGFHGANGNSSQVAPSYFGLWNLSEGSTIFVAPDAVDGLWNATRDTAMVSDLIEQLSNELCIDTSRIGIEGFSQGGAMVWTLACALPGIFRFAVVHSGGGLPMPQSCEPIPFFSALGTDGSGQGMSSDYFAEVNGCTVEPLPEAPSGGHACTNYDGCDEGFPTRWCDYDAGHLPDPRDAGQSSSWVPGEVWSFITEY